MSEDEEEAERRRSSKKGAKEKKHKKEKRQKKEKRKRRSAEPGEGEEEDEPEQAPQQPQEPQQQPFKGAFSQHDDRLQRLAQERWAPMLTTMRCVFCTAGQHLLWQGVEELCSMHCCRFVLCCAACGTSVQRMS
jgi:hypothetical protein